MAVLPIHILGSKSLEAKTKEVVDLTPDVVGNIITLFDTLKSASGSGLAACQVGINQSMFVIDLSYIPEEDNAELELSNEFKKPMVFINPVIEKEWDSCVMEEGCLSIPKLTADVKRAKNVRITYRDGNFNQLTLETGGYLARVLQHETDHLNAVLYINRLSSIQKLKLKSDLKKIRKGDFSAKYKFTFG